MKLKIKIMDAVKINRTKKEFLVFVLDENDKLINYSFTNDIARYGKAIDDKYQFTSIEKIKPQIKNFIVNI